MFADIDKRACSRNFYSFQAGLVPPSPFCSRAMMASMSRFGTGLTRRSRLLDESAAALRCPACLQRQAPFHTTVGPSRSPLQYWNRNLAANGGGSSSGGQRSYSQKSQQRPRFSSRLRMALGNSKTEWYFIPVGVGIGFLGAVQGYKVYAREKENQENEAQDKKPKRRPRIRPDGPWCVPHIRAVLVNLTLTTVVGRFRSCLRFL